MIIVYCKLNSKYINTKFDIQQHYSMYQVCIEMLTWISYSESTSACSKYIIDVMITFDIFALS